MRFKVALRASRSRYALQGRATRFNSYYRVGDNSTGVWVVYNDCTVLVSYNYYWAVQEQVAWIVVEECNKSSMLQQR
jgi:hypothetical protein